MIDRWDVLGAAGLGLVAAGLWLYDPRWALVCVGTVVFVIATLGALRG